MKLTHLRPALLFAFCSWGFATAASAQNMPQDNWRYVNLQFSSPVPTNQLRSIAIGGICSAAEIRTVLQFTEAGGFIRRFTDMLGYTDSTRSQIHPPNGKHRAIDRVDDQQVGQWSAEVSVMVR